MYSRCLAPFLTWEGLKERLKQLVCIINAFCVLANNPNHRGLRLRLIQSIEVFAEGANDGFILVWVPSEDVLRPASVFQLTHTTWKVQSSSSGKNRGTGECPLPVALTLITMIASCTT